MIKYMLTEVVKSGKVKEDKAYREKLAPVLQKYGLKETVWSVEGKKRGQILLDWGEFDSREQADELIAKVFADEEWIQLQEERDKAEVIVPGTGELWVLTDY